MKKSCIDPSDYDDTGSLIRGTIYGTLFSLPVFALVALLVWLW